MFEKMFRNEDDTSIDHGVKLTCADESVFSALAHYYSRVEAGESLCGMSVRLFYPEAPQEQLISLDAVSWRNTMLISDVQAKGLPTEVLKEQDIVCVYRTDSEENFAVCAERLTALQEDGGCPLLCRCRFCEGLCLWGGLMGTASIAGGWCDMGRCFAASCIDKGESAMDLGRISPVRGATVSEWSSTGGTADFQRLKRTFHVRCDGKIGSHRRLFCRWGQCSMAD